MSQLGYKLEIPCADAASLCMIPPCSTTVIALVGMTECALKFQADILTLSTKYRKAAVTFVVSVRPFVLPSYCQHETTFPTERIFVTFYFRN